MKPRYYGTSVTLLAHLFGGGQVRHVCPYCHQAFERSYTVDQLEARLFQTVIRCPHCHTKARYESPR